MKTLLISIALIFAFPCIASENAPFGLKWGVGVEDLRKQGIELQKDSAEGRLEIFSAKSLPKNLSIAESYSLVFDQEFGLQKILMLSEDITDDAFGSEGKEMYDDIKSKLKNKYGEPTKNFEIVGLRLYDESDEFYQCLSYDGCGAWVSAFEDKEQVIAVQIKGMRRGHGYITLTYEGPKWKESLDANKAESSKSDSDAL